MSGSKTFGTTHRQIEFAHGRVIDAHHLAPISAHNPFPLPFRFASAPAPDATIATNGCILMANDGLRCDAFVRRQRSIVRWRDRDSSARRISALLLNLDFNARG